MAMITKVHPLFWEDRDIRSLEATEKLAWVWLLTNSSRNLIGFSKVTEDKFAYDTAIPSDTLSKTLHKMERSVAWEEVRGTYGILLLNFINHQLTVGQRNPANPLGKSVYQAACELPAALRIRFFEHYPDLSKPLAGHSDAPDTSNQSLPRDKYREEKRREEQYSSVPSDDEVLNYSRTWSGEMTSGTPVMDPDWVLAWLKRMASRSGDWPANWQRAMIAAWRADFRAGWRPQPVNQKNGVLFVNGHKQAGAWELKQRIELLRAKMQSHPGNTDSAACVGQPSDDEVAEFEKICAEKGALEQQLGAMA